MYDKLVPHPTGTNAYEDYIRAADIVTGPEFDVLMAWTPHQAKDLLHSEKEQAEDLEGQPEGYPLPLPKMGTPPGSGSQSRVRRGVTLSLKDSDYVTVGLRLAQRFGTALDLIHSGNGKPYNPPPISNDQAAGLGVLHGYKVLVRLANAVAYARFATGDGAGATTVLTDAMTLSRRLSQGVLVENIIGNASLAIAIGGLDEHLSHLSSADAERLIRYTDAAIAEPHGLDGVMEHERLFAQASIRARQDVGDESDDADDAEKALGKAWKRWNLPERERYQKTLTSSIDAVYGRLIRSARGDETGLHERLVALESQFGPDKARQGTDVSPEGMASEEAQSLASLWFGSDKLVLRTRAQLRLLGLHARVIEFRWKFKRLPTKLEECVPASVVFDPLSGVPFVYELRDNSYELYSKGLKETGRVDLKYKATEMTPPSGTP